MTDPDERRDAVGADGVTEVRDVTLGTADPADYSASDVGPIEDEPLSTLEAMLRSPDAPSRRRALLELARRDAGTEYCETVAELARTDPDEQVRQFALEALGKLDGDPAVAIDRLENDDDPWVRAEAAVTLDRLDREAHEDRFEDLLDDEAEGVRRNALVSLTQVRGEDAREDLLAAIDDPSDRVREWAVKLLGQFDDDPAVERALEGVLDDQEETEIVRESAARALGARGETVQNLLQDGTGTASADDHMLNRVPDA